MSFKNINATFKLTICDWSTGKVLDKPLLVEIKRKLSGAFAYGDRSSHTIMVNGNHQYSFDTRYDGISSEKGKWLKFWKEWLNDNWKINTLEEVSYSEEIMEVTE